MIYFVDDFLDKNLIRGLQLDDSPFEKVDFPDKSFWVKYPSPQFVDYVCAGIYKIEKRLPDPILAFFREAKDGQDDDWRIHNDTIINGKVPDRAIVLYISDDNKELSGTAFWEHKEHGDKYTLDITETQFNEVLKDSEDTEKWTLKTIIGHKPNRLLSYPSNYFHSKYPNEFKDSRVVFVMFYNYVEA